MKIKILLLVTLIFFGAFVFFLVSKASVASAAKRSNQEMIAMLHENPAKESRLQENDRAIRSMAEDLRKLQEINPSDHKGLGGSPELKAEIQARSRALEQKMKENGALSQEVNKDKAAADQKRAELDRLNSQSKSSTLGLWFSLLGTVISSGTSIAVAMINKKK